MIITKEQLENTEEGRLDIDFLEIIPEINPDKPVEAALAKFKQRLILNAIGA